MCRTTRRRSSRVHPTVLPRPQNAPTTAAAWGIASPSPTWSRKLPAEPANATRIALASATLARRKVAPPTRGPTRRPSTTSGASRAEPATRPQPLRPSLPTPERLQLTLGRLQPMQVAPQPLRRPAPRLALSILSSAALSTVAKSVGQAFVAASTVSAGKTRATAVPDASRTMVLTAATHLQALHRRLPA